MKTIIIGIAIALAACGVDAQQSPTTAVADQSLCKLDPTTGRCALNLDPDGQPATRAQLRGQYPGATPLDGGCDHGTPSGLQNCHVHVSGMPFGYSLFSCDILWTFTDAPPEEGGGWSIEWISCTAR